MLDLVYSALKKRLVASTEPEYLEWFYGQYDESEMEEGGELLWTTPAQFIEFLPLDWETRPMGIQTSVLRFNVHLVNESFDPGEQRILNASLNHLGGESAIFKALMNFRCLLSYVPGFEDLEGTEDDRVLIESIVRESTESDHTMRRQLVSVQRFSCRIFDYSALPNWTDVLAGLDLDILNVDQL